MATRFTDDFFNNTDGSDFIVRRRLPVALQIFFVFAIAFDIIYVSGCLMNPTGSTYIFLATVGFTIGALTWFTVYNSANLRDLVLATEFQNAMLASAAQLSTRFCLITKRDGSIVYIDQGFQKMFPQFMESSGRNIDALLESASAPREAISRIVLMLQHGESNRLPLQLQGGDGKTYPIMLSVDLLPRPRGYFLMRGRDYVEKREGEATPMETSANIGLEQALNLLPEGILVTNMDGVITYANQMLEKWLGFAPGELRARPFKIQQILYQYTGSEAGKPVYADFTGEAVLQRKDRSLVNCHIRQVSYGKPAGIGAIIRVTEPFRGIVP